MGASHLANKSGNFGLRSNGKAIFRENIFGKSRQPPEVVHMD